MYFNKDERKIFKKNLNIDEDTWNRGKIWALWKLLIDIKIKPEILDGNIKSVNEILKDLISYILKKKFTILEKNNINNNV
jgi:Na+/H+ antiporter NhaA